MPADNHKLRLTNPRRIEIIKRHRQWAVAMSQIKGNSKDNLVRATIPPRVKQQAAKSLVGLKSMSLKDHVYNGYFLSLTIIEETYSWSPSIHLVVEDENLDCEQICIYSFPQAQGEYLIKEVFKIGTKMNVLNPYLRIGTYDMKPMVRVDEFLSIIMQDETERVINMCRYCGKPNLLHVCAKCEKARYCSKECQTMDWKLYEHNQICKHQ